MTNEITALITQGRVSEAVEMLKVKLQDMAESERASILLAVTQLYMKASNEANKQYSKSLSSMISTLKGIDQAEKKLEKIGA